MLVSILFQRIVYGERMLKNLSLRNFKNPLANHKLDISMFQAKTVPTWLFGEEQQLMIGCILNYK